MPGFNDTLITEPTANVYLSLLSYPPWVPSSLPPGLPPETSARTVVVPEGFSYSPRARKASSPAPAAAPVVAALDETSGPLLLRGLPRRLLVVPRRCRLSLRPSSTLLGRAFRLPPPAAVVLVMMVGAVTTHVLLFRTRWWSAAVARFAGPYLELPRPPPRADVPRLFTGPSPEELVRCCVSRSPSSSRPAAAAVR